MLTISNCQVPLEATSDKALRRIAAKVLGVQPADVLSCTVAKRSVDARKKNSIHFVMSLNVELSDPWLEQRALQAKHARGISVRPAKPYEPLSIPQLGSLFQQQSVVCRPVVVGAGPAGLFAALYLARAGLRPLLVERGANVEQRAQDVEHFKETGALDPSSNVQFGEGGAGTFSDGKLTTNVKNPLTTHVLQWFVDAGAPQEILWQAHPHLGSDNLPRIVAAMREEILQRGGQVRFHTRLAGLELEGQSLSRVRLENVKTGECRVEDAGALVLACGHSARDTFALVRDAGFAMERKPFSVGVRIEHPQKLINRSQWGKMANHPALGAAEYKLAVHLPNGRSVYTFCMCPGGEVVAAASEEGGIVTNGMSDFARAGANANAALLVSVGPDDYPGTDVLGGVELQRSIEQAAFALSKQCGGQAYQAPAQTVGSFLAHVAAGGNADVPDQAGANATDASKSPRGMQAAQPVSVADAGVRPTYGRGVVEAPIARCFPAYVSESLACALPLLNRKLKGFAAPDALLTAPETRSSSPVRILRDASLQAYFAEGGASEGAPCDRPEIVAAGTGIYPCGEGPGYAGGIMSAAVDGIRVAASVAQRIASQLTA